MEQAQCMYVNGCHLASICYIFKWHWNKRHFPGCTNSIQFQTDPFSQTGIFASSISQLCKVPSRVAKSKKIMQTHSVEYWVCFEYIRISFQVKPQQLLLLMFHLQTDAGHLLRVSCFLFATGRGRHICCSFDFLCAKMFCFLSILNIIRNWKTSKNFASFFETLSHLQWIFIILSEFLS